MKKIFAILLAMSAMAMVLNGCGGGEKPADDAAKPADATAPAEPAK